MDAITLLREDHALLSELATKLAETREEAVVSRRTRLAQIERVLRACTAVEQELFYPAYLLAASDPEAQRQVADALAAHRDGDDKILLELRRLDPSTVAWSDAAKALKDHLFRRFEAAESELFPGVRRRIDRRDMRILGDRMSLRREQLLAEVQV